MPEWVGVIVFTAAAYLTLFIITRIEGKRQIAQLEFMDYVIAITIGSIAAEMCTNNEKRWYLYILAMGIMFLLDTITTLLSRKGHFLKKLFHSMPLTIIDDGKISYQNLKKSKLDVNELLAQLRVLGYFDIQDVAYAILETSGDISVLPKSAQRPTTIADVGVSEQPASLTENIIIDGKILKDTLVSIKRSEQWVFNKLGIKEKKQLKNIILAIYDEENDDVIAYKKDMQKKQEQKDFKENQKTKKELGVKEQKGN